MSRALAYLRDFEPVRAKALWAALLLLLTSLGIGIPAGLDGRVQTTITAVGVLLPLLLAEWQRLSVTPNKKVAAVVDPQSHDIVAGPASDVPDGEPVELVYKSRHAAEG